MTRTICGSAFDDDASDGRAKGKVKGKIAALLSFLQAKFQRVPSEIEFAIRRMTDPVALDSLIAYATTCQTLDEFEKALN